MRPLSRILGSAAILATMTGGLALGLGGGTAGAVTRTVVWATLFFDSPQLVATATCTPQVWPNDLTSPTYTSGKLSVVCTTETTEFFQAPAVIAGPLGAITFGASTMSISATVTFDVEGCAINLSTGVTLTGIGTTGYELATPYATAGRITVTTLPGGSTAVCVFIQTALETGRATFTGEFGFGS